MLEIVQTADGSNTIYNALVGENYHSRYGALQESRHVFVKSGLAYYLETQKEQTEVSVLEVGFGTGLNFLLSAGVCAEKGIALNYTGIEAFPISLDMIGQTGYGQYIEGTLWDRFIENYEDVFNAPVEINAYCKLQVARCGLMDFESENHYDIIFFDAFAAARQPEMWDTAAIGHTIRFLKPGGVFVTYAITGNLKRMLKALGCKIEKAPGAPGKREMLRAVKQNLPAQNTGY
jgi:tRNA U34 5-methylaminomethyl-2-thiouridine-forming methyltransferase MnmC